MQVSQLNVTQDAAIAALKQYKEHRGTYDARDWQIERIYRAIAKGKKVISVADSIRNAGFNVQGQPLLAVCRADSEMCRCDVGRDEVVFTRTREMLGGSARINIPWKNTSRSWISYALLPRIPPQFRPPTGKLHNYHLLWEADWTAIPRDPILLRRIGADAWVVLAAWDLTDVEMNVLRSART